MVYCHVMDDKTINDTVDTIKKDNVDNPDTVHVQMPNSATDDVLLVGLDEAVKISGRTKRTLSRWIENGKLSRFDGDITKNGYTSSMVDRSELLLLMSGTRAPRSDTRCTPKVENADNGVDDIIGKQRVIMENGRIVSMTPSPEAGVRIQEMEMEAVKLRHEMEVRGLQNQLQQARLVGELEAEKRTVAELQPLRLKVHTSIKVFW